MNKLGNIAIGMLVGILIMCVLVSICPGLVFPIALVAVMMLEGKAAVLAAIAGSALAGYLIALVGKYNRAYFSAYGALAGMVATVAYVTYVVYTARW